MPRHFQFGSGLKLAALAAASLVVGCSDSQSNLLDGVPSIAYLQRTPTRYYLELRLQKARTLLLQTSLSVLDVALACGFVSASHFSKCYREFYAKTPRQERQLEG